MKLKSLSFSHLGLSRENTVLSNNFYLLVSFKLMKKMSKTEQFKITTFNMLERDARDSTSG